jgi:hypothetical protein
MMVRSRTIAEARVVRKNHRPPFDQAQDENLNT